MFYDVFVTLCANKGVTPVQVRKILGISQSTMASWKSRNLTPNATTLVKLADYFGVSIDSLLTSITEEELSTRAVGSSSIYDRINIALRSLNDEGRQVALDRVEELTEIPKYQRKKAPTDGD